MVVFCGNAFLSGYTDGALNPLGDCTSRPSIVVGWEEDKWNCSPLVGLLESCLVLDFLVKFVEDNIHIYNLSLPINIEPATGVSDLQY